jgi:hypothetical protein
MPRQIVTTSGTVQSTTAATGSTVAERDASGDLTNVHTIGSTALNYPGIAGGIYLKQATKTTDYTVVDGDGLICVTVGAANRTVTLPPAASSQYAVVTVKRLDATEFTLTVDGNASETIDGQASVYVNAQYESATFWCDGSNWHETGRSTPQIPTAKSANFTVGGGGPVYLITVGAGTITATLPPAAEMKGQDGHLQARRRGRRQRHVHHQQHRDHRRHQRPERLVQRRGQQYDVLVITSDGSNWHTTGDVD